MEEFKMYSLVLLKVKTTEFNNFMKILWSVPLPSKSITSAEIFQLFKGINAEKGYDKLLLNSNKAVFLHSDTKWENLTSTH